MTPAERTLARLKARLSRREAAVVFPAGDELPSNDMIVRWVALQTGQAVPALRGATRYPELFRGRAAAAFIAHRTRETSTVAIGRALGGRDHSTIANALRRAEEMRAEDGDFRLLTDRGLRIFDLSDAAEDMPCLL